MMYRIKQKKTVLVFTLVLLVFLSQNIYHSSLAIAGPAEDLATRMYEQYKGILTRSDLLPLLPVVLPALKDPKFANPDFYTPIFFNPEQLREHLTNVDAPVLGAFIALLQEVPNVQEIFLDADFAGLYGNAAAIDALLVLLKPKTGNQVKIDSAFVNVSRYGTLRMTGSPLHIGDSVSVGTSHTLIFTVIDAEGNPVPGLPLSFRLQPLNGAAASGTFNYSTVITNQTGSAHVQVTFGPEPGDLRLLIDVNTQEIVDVVELELTRGNNTRVHKVTVKGIEHKFAPISTTRTLVFTATDPNGQPVEGEELTFGFRGASGSSATAAFLPTVAMTDQSGEARTQVTFGSEPGGIHLTVRSGPAVEQVNITSSQINLGSQVQGTFTGLQVGDSVDVGSTHKLVFTAKDMRGRPVSGLPIAFGGSPLELEVMFDPATATTDRNGKVQTEITFGPEPGDFQLLVSIDSQKVIAFSEPEFSLEATNITNLKVQGMEEGFAQPGSSINLILTATDARGRPVAGEELVFGIGIIPDNRVTAVFKPAKVKTNKRGKAQTRVSFGSEPGEMRLTVKSGVIIHSVSLDLEPYGTLSLKGLQVGDAVKVKSTHSLVFTATNDAGEPVPWLPLRFNAVSLDGSNVGTTFKPARVVTNKNGKARTSITLGAAHGEIRLIAEADRGQIIELLPPKITLDDTKVAKLTFEGIEQGFARVGTTRNLSITAKNKNGRPVSGVNLSLGFRSPSESKASVTFSEVTVITDKKGQAQTEVTFGENPGSIRFTVGSLDGMRIQEVRSDIKVSTLRGDLTSESFEIGDTFKIDSTHNFVYTAAKSNGNPVPWLPVRFDAEYVDGTEAEVTFTPATAVTNNNGKARTRVTFSGDPGDLRLIVEVDRKQIVEFLEPEFTLEGSGISELRVSGIERAFARLSSTRTFVFTAIDANGDPVEGATLTFDFETESRSRVRATFSPTSATTDGNGEIEIEVAFGDHPGSIRFTAQSVGRVTINSLHHTDYDSFPLGFSDFTYEGFEINDVFDANSTHTIAFTARDEDGNPISGVPVILSILPQEPSSTDVPAPSAALMPKGSTSSASSLTERMEATTDENGKVIADVTFGPNPGPMYFDISPDISKMVRVIAPSLILKGGVTSLKFEGFDIIALQALENYNLFIDEGVTDDPSRQIAFAAPNSTHKLVFTASDAKSQPMEDVQLTFGFGIELGDKATAALAPATATTDTDGKAITYVTFGNNPGSISVEATAVPQSTLSEGYKQVIIDSVNLGLISSELTYEGFELGDAFELNSTHTFTFTVTDESGEPLSGLPLEFEARHSVDSPIDTTATFRPATATTDVNGSVQTDVTFGLQSGSISLWIGVDRQKAIQISQVILGGGHGVASLTVKGIHGISEGGPTFVMPNSTHKLVFAATDENGDPVEGAEISLSDNTVRGRETTATFEPVKITTDEMGMAETLVTFGSPGQLYVYAYVTGISKTEVTERRPLDSENALRLLGVTGPDDINLILEGLEPNVFFLPVLAKHLTFIAIEKRGDPIEGMILTFSFQPTEESTAGATFSRVTATTDQDGVARTDLFFDGAGTGDFHIHVEGTRQSLPAEMPEIDGVRVTGVGASDANLTVEGIQLNTALSTDSTHRLVFTATEDNGDPLQQVSLTFLIDPEGDSEATATFSPQTVTTDDRGKAVTNIDFGPKSGALFIYARVPPKEITGGVKLLGITGPEDVNLTFEADYDQIGEGSVVLTRSTHTLVFTATEKNGLPIQGGLLTFSAESAEDSAATAKFITHSSATDANGKASAHIAFGPNPGAVLFRVQVSRETKHVKFLGATWTKADGLNTPPVNLTLEGIQSNTLVPAGVTQQLVLTATDTDLRLMRGVRFALSLGDRSTTTATFTPAIAVTDENGIATTQVTFGSNPGDIEIDVVADRRLVVFEDMRVSRPHRIDVTLEGMEVGESFLDGFTRRLIFTAADANDTPLQGVPLTLSLSGNPMATAFFTSNILTTNENGKAVTDVTFGPKLGEFYGVFSLNVEVKAVRMTISRLSTANGLPLKGGYYLKGDGFEQSKPLILPFGATYTLPFTVTNEFGDLLQDAQISFTNTPGVTVNPTTVTTDQVGRAFIRVTVGHKPENVGINPQLIQDIEPTQVWVLGMRRYFAGEVALITIEGLEFGKKVPLGSTHRVVFTAKDENGNPVSGVGLFLNYGSNPALQFNPNIGITDSNGKVGTTITFGNIPGEIILDVRVQVGIELTDIFILRLSEKLHEIPNLPPTGYSFLPGSTHRLAFTITEEDPALRRVPITFSLENEGDSNVTATFNPDTATPNENGEVVTEVTFGPNIGRALIIGYPQNVGTFDFYSDGGSSVNINLLPESIQDSTPYLKDTTYPLAIKVTDKDGSPVEGLRIIFGVNSDSRYTSSERIPNSPAPDSPTLGRVEPDRGTTDQNGEVRTSFIGGQAPDGRAYAWAAVMPALKFEKLTLTKAHGIDNMTVEISQRSLAYVSNLINPDIPTSSLQMRPIKEGDIFELPSLFTQQSKVWKRYRLAVTLKDTNGKPIPNVPLDPNVATGNSVISVPELTFDFRTDQNGVAALNFDIENPGVTNLNIQVRDEEPAKLKLRVKEEFHSNRGDELFIASVLNASGKGIPYIQIKLKTENRSYTERTESDGERQQLIEFSRAGGHDVLMTARDWLGNEVNKSFRFFIKGPSGVCTALPPSDDVQENAGQFLNLAKNKKFGENFYLVDEFNKLSGLDLPLNVPLRLNTSSIQTSLQWYRWSTLAKDLGVKVIRVRFVNGSGSDHDYVKSAIQEWQKHANILFWITDGPADIRIRFYDGTAGDSYIGTKSWYIWNEGTLKGVLRILDKAVDTFYIYLLGFIGILSSIDPHVHDEAGDQYWVKSPSMNIPRDPKTGVIKRYVILHEFGHALGFHHSHQVKEFPFEWKNKDDIYQNYEDKKDADTNIFKKAPLPWTSDWDPYSIMSYKLETDWIEAPENAPEWIKKIADEGIPQQYILTDLDKQAVENVYGPPVDDKVLAVTGRVTFKGFDDELILDEEDESWDVFTLFIGRPPEPGEYTYTHLSTFSWGGELRSTLDIGLKERNDNEIKLSGLVKLFEGTNPETTDLDGESRTEFTLLNKSKNEDGSPFWQEFKMKRAENPGWLVGGDWVDVRLELWVDDQAIDAKHGENYAGSDIRDLYRSTLAPSISNAKNVSDVDVNADGQVNLADLLLVANYLGLTAPTSPPVDINRDGIVTIVDLVKVAQHFHKLTNLAAPPRITMPPGLTYNTIQGWIEDARAADDGSIAFRQGILNLELLLALIVPEKSTLLANYPNPFNPETWLPYHLAEPAEVTLNIYAVDGRLVRTLALGYQFAGFYESKSRAAYWDGRNNVGERVASGIYFYTITAGDFSATKKMLIQK